MSEPEVPVPPYERERDPEHDALRAEGVQKAYDADNAPAPDSDVPVSDEERSGMSDTDTEPEPAHGVGASRRRSGEDIAPDRPDTGTKGASQRPEGKVAEDDLDAFGQESDG
jgi:hypothetical protein